MADRKPLTATQRERLQKALKKRCPRHPSMPALLCTCSSPHTQLGEARPERPRGVYKDESIHAACTLAIGRYRVTICGACGALAADHSSTRNHACIERSVTLQTFIRTSICKHCGEDVNNRMPCDSNPEGTTHERKWLPRSKRVSACLSCANLISIRVEPDDWNVMPACFVEAWCLKLSERTGLTPKRRTSEDELSEYGEPTPERPLRIEAPPTFNPNGLIGGVAKLSDDWRALMAAPHSAVHTAPTPDSPVQLELRALRERLARCEAGRHEHARKVAEALRVRIATLERAERGTLSTGYVEAKEGA